jgi:hypothetical protein
MSTRRTVDAKGYGQATRIRAGAWLGRRPISDADLTRDRGAEHDANRSRGNPGFPNPIAPVRPIWWIHGARDRGSHALAGEVAQLAANHASVQTRVAYSRPGPTDEPGVHYDTHGRVTAALIDDFVETPGAHYYMCGPTRFMADVHDGLEARGIAPERIHTKSLGAT